MPVQNEGQEELSGSPSNGQFRAQQCLQCLGLVSDSLGLILAMTK